MPGYFTRVALPRALDALRAAHPAVAFAQAEPLGAHPALAALVRRRAEAVGAGRGSAVLLAAHGSPDPTANGPIHVVATMLAEAGVFANASVCYLGLNAPDIPTALTAQFAAGVWASAAFVLVAGGLSLLLPTNAGPRLKLIVLKDLGEQHD